MGRPKEFDPDQALEDAMHVFWEKGYQGASMQDLLDAMGINRGSLYGTFGNKEQLFQRAVDRYCQQRTEALVDALAQPGDPKEILSGFFERVLTMIQEDAVGRGCFMTNATVEVAPHCEKTAEKVTANRQRMEDAFFQLVTRKADLRNRPRAVARFLVGVLNALTVTGKTTQCTQALEDIVEVAVSVLD